VVITDVIFEQEVVRGEEHEWKGPARAARDDAETRLMRLIRFLDTLVFFPRPRRNIYPHSLPAILNVTQVPFGLHGALEHAARGLLFLNLIVSSDRILPPDETKMKKPETLLW